MRKERKKERRKSKKGEKDDNRANETFNLNEVIPLCIYIFTLLLYISVNTTIIEYNTSAPPIHLCAVDRDHSTRLYKTRNFQENDFCFILLLYIAVNTTIIEYDTSATCFNLQ